MTQVSVPSVSPSFEIDTPVGVIADTHGLLRDEACHVLEGCALILHLGDVGDEAILERLAVMAPLFTVRGNIDTQPWCNDLPMTQTLRVNGYYLHLVHNIADFDHATPCDAVLHGHSHKPRNEWRQDDGALLPRLYFNPGGAGKRRFSLPITVGKLWLSPQRLQGAIIHLPLA
ncbi:metallophosphoesterase family protein [Phytohalomonas tamaricis]|uniref:metallophosphoesterase family protein n=1 Tax=Phytohalomonas tamaricis TaxID=2081032 RepID=UPI000D0AC45E|nr:metallophosphoesterase family protein [Phytohalomonas tamaricis]